MNDKIVECVPNFSEGRRKDVIDAIAKAISDTVGCTLLDVDPGTATNRTVYTFVGAPDVVVQAALAAAKIAYQRIDMKKHTGGFSTVRLLNIITLMSPSLRRASAYGCVGCVSFYSYFQRLYGRVR